MSDSECDTCYGVHVDIADPRAVRTRSKILDATCEVIAENGISGATMDAVAASAGISRSTLYRHWSDLPTLIFAAIEHIAPIAPTQASSTPITVIRTSIESLGMGLRSGPWSLISPALAEAAGRDEAIASLHAAYVAARRKPLLRAVKAAQRAGDINVSVDPEWLVTALAAPLYYHHLVLHQPMSPPAITRHLDKLLQLVG